MGFFSGLGGKSDKGWQPRGQSLQELLGLPPGQMLPQAGMGVSPQGPDPRMAQPMSSRLPHGLPFAEYMRQMGQAPQPAPAMPMPQAPQPMPSRMGHGLTFEELMRQMQMRGGR